MAAWKQYRTFLQGQLLVFTVLAGGAVLATSLLHWSDGQVFARFLGHANPVVAMLAAGAVGMTVLVLLVRQGHFFIFKKQPRPALWPFLGLAAALAVIMILVDSQVVFPADINILFPESILFYPAIAFFVEILFHVVPLGFLLLIFHPASKLMPRGLALWLVFILVAIPEPAYQLLAMAEEGRYSRGLLIYLGLHLFVFNLLQLYTFWRRDFLSMYLLRLTYYLLWHIAWGQIRLGILF